MQGVPPLDLLVCVDGTSCSPCEAHQDNPPSGIAGIEVCYPIGLPVGVVLCQLGFAGKPGDGSHGCPVFEFDFIIS